MRRVETRGVRFVEPKAPVSPHRVYAGREEAGRPCGLRASASPRA
jgi:hypothetical protein